MRTEEVILWGGIAALTAVLALMVFLSFGHRRRLRAELQQRLDEASDTNEGE